MAEKETDEARKLRQRRECDRYEADHDLVPGSTSHAGDRRGPEGGVSWEGAARMAAARRHAGVRLTPRDREALDRHPQT